MIGASSSGGARLGIYQGVDPARAYLDGTSGQTTVSACRWVDAGTAKGWHCHRTFTGQDLHIPGVQMRFALDVEPDGPVDTVVSGPDATVAWVPGPELVMPMSAGVFMAGIAPTVWLALWWRDRGERAAERAQEAERRQRWAALQNLLRDQARDTAGHSRAD